jgi:hypothetical protein
VVEKVRQYVLSNLEQDMLGDVEEQTKIAMAKGEALHDPRVIIDNIASGLVAISDLHPDYIRIALREFMTYMKE